MRRQQSPEQQRAPVGVTEQQSRRLPPPILAGRPLAAASPRTERGGGSLRRPAATVAAAAVHPQQRRGRLGAPMASPRTAAAAAAAQRTASTTRAVVGTLGTPGRRQPARISQPARSESIFDVEPSGRREQSTDNPLSKDETHQMMTVADIFGEIDLDHSGQIDFAEFEHWWRQHGDASKIAAFQSCFETVENRGGASVEPGVNVAEFEEIVAVVAADGWLERPNPQTGEREWENQETKETNQQDPAAASRARALDELFLAGVAAKQHERRPSEEEEEDERGCHHPCVWVCGWCLRCWLCGW